MAARRTGGHAVLVAAGILLSRIAGLVRERVFAHYLGNSDAAGAFRAALRIPNFLQNLFGEGVLSASFIPVYSRLLAEKREEEAGRVAGAVAATLALAVSALVSAGVALTPAFVDLVAPGFRGELRELTVSLVRVLFPGVGLLVLSAWCLGVLNSHRKFFLSYLAPVFWNMAMIGTLVACGARGLAGAELAVALAWGTVAGSALQLGVQLPLVFRSAWGLRFGLSRSGSAGEVFRNLGPVVLGRGVVQLSAYVDGVIASFLGAAAVSGLGYAQTIYLLPVSLFGMSVAAAELPEMSSAVGGLAEVGDKLRARLRSGQRRIAFFVIPSVVGFALLGRWIVAALYQTGRFGVQDTRLVWYVLLGSTVGLLSATWGRLYSSAFYALRDTRTPLKLAVVRVSLTAALGVLFSFPLRPYLAALFERVLRLPLPPGGEEAMGAVGLTASAGIAGWIEFALLRAALSRRIGGTGVSASFQLRAWGAAVLAGAVSGWFGRVADAGGLGAVMTHPVPACVGVVAVFGVFYFAVGAVLGLEEARRVIFLPSGR